MKLSLHILLALGTGTGAGALFGAMVLAPAGAPPTTAPDVSILGAIPPAPLPATVTAAVKALATADQAPSAPALRAPSEGDEADTTVLVPSPARHAAVFEDDTSLIPRGPGRFAILDLSRSGKKQLVLHAGRMERDGGLSPSLARAGRRLARLHGPKVRVELLHLAFDRDGRPTVAHVRTTRTLPLEGLVLLQNGERTVRVRPDREQGRADEEPF